MTEWKKEAAKALGDVKPKEYIQYKIPTTGKSIAQKAAERGFLDSKTAQDAVKTVAGKGISKLASGALGALGGVLLSPTPAGAGSDKLPDERAKGGPVKKGKKYIVGEKGPEMFVPERSGKIVPNTVKRQPGGRGRPQTVSKDITKMPFKKK